MEDSERKLMDMDGRPVWSLKRATQELAIRTGKRYTVDGRGGAVFSPLHKATSWRKSEGADAPDIPPKLSSFRTGGVKFIYVDDFEAWFVNFRTRKSSKRSRPLGDVEEEHDDG